MFNEARGNLWDLWTDEKREAGVPLVITTNGFVKKNGCAVMGRGIALEASQRYSWMPRLLGRLLSEVGNQVHTYKSEVDGKVEHIFVFFPVKHKWNEEADLELIERSTKELVALADFNEWDEVLMPRPGCGNGRLDWRQVKDVLERYLDERFTVVTFDNTN